jgi:hypothetical protein
MNKIHQLFCALFIIMFCHFLSNDSIAQVASLEATLTLKPVDGIKIPFQNGFALPTFEKQNRQIINLKGDWKSKDFLQVTL